MKKYELTMVTRDGDKFEVRTIDKIEGDSIIEILSQFQFVIHNTLKKEAKSEIDKLKEQFLDDDIPF